VRITKRRDIVRLLVDNGWTLARSGKHAVYTNPAALRPMPVPFEWNGELPPGTIHKIRKAIRAAGGNA
jgi:predicted RNA binding protein YcfA (HicA-like mRNA interferase family)